MTCTHNGVISTKKRLGAQNPMSFLLEQQVAMLKDI